LIRGAAYGKYLPLTETEGYLLYSTRRAIFSVPFNIPALRISGDPVPLIDNVASNADIGVPVVFDVSYDGTLVFRHGTRSSQLQWVDASDRTAVMSNVPQGVWPVLSPDGNRLAISVDGDIWVYDILRQNSTRLTFESGRAPTTGIVWSPDGRYVIYRAENGTAWVRADGGSPHVFIDEGWGPSSFAPDGRHLLLRQTLNSPSDITVVTTTVDDQGVRAGKPAPFWVSPASEVGATFSPDGRFVAYSSNESGAYQVQVRRFPDDGTKWQVSTDSGYNPVWSRSTPELFYVTDERRIMVVRFSTDGGVFKGGPPRVWSQRLLEGLPTNRLFDVHPDGKRIVGNVTPDGLGAQQASRVTFFFNVRDELQRRFTGAK
jgi:serine/threonine-protein kinase